MSRNNARSRKKVASSAYSVTKRNPLTNEAESIRIWDLYYNIHPINQGLVKHFSLHPEQSILVLDKANNDKILKLNKFHMWPGVNVFTTAGLYYEDVARVRPGFIKEQLDPSNNAEWGSPITLVGVIPNDRAPLYNIIKQTGMDKHWHVDPEEYARATPNYDRNRYACFKWNCPVCKQLQYTMQKFEELGFLNASVKVWLSQSIHPPRVREYDELTTLVDC